MEPDVLFMDEPFTYLDLPTRANLVSELKGILAETGTTAVMVTHDLNEIPFLADRLIVMMEGEIAQAGPVNRVLSYPNTVRVAEFLGVTNIWSARITERQPERYVATITAGGPTVLEVCTAQGASGEREYAPGTAVSICIRPEYIIINNEKAKSVQGTNMLEGIISEAYPYGYCYRLKIGAGSGNDLKLVAMVPAAQFLKPPKPGDTIGVFIPPEKIHIIPD
ncbi:TOBE domain-containing protein [Phosphitispora sp. TUW77]|uniref:TOBE domain-containing protein n=1 Tax=Phosphitispora sp. TUW77 TaxID=3152361 RepID=UPI003AB85D66